MSKDLIETLDALNNERPNMLQFKRKHFEIKNVQTKSERLDWMRLNAERDRIE